MDQAKIDALNALPKASFPTNPYHGQVVKSQDGWKIYDAEFNIWGVAKMPEGVAK